MRVQASVRWCAVHRGCPPVKWRGGAGKGAAAGRGRYCSVAPGPFSRTLRRPSMPTGTSP
ncbi:hypothetical protein UE98_24745 [Burkholderia cenocepacia]|nr:hypothetical protein UE98_24745 [Burkholderia cenocepacia]